MFEFGVSNCCGAEGVGVGCWKCGSQSLLLFFISPVRVMRTTNIYALHKVSTDLADAL